MKYYVCPPDQSSWTMAPADFIANLRAQWPNAKVRQVDISPEFSHEWEIPGTYGPVDGQFYVPGPGITLRGDFEDCVAVALWFRSLAPPHEQLLFFDESFGIDVPLLPQTTVADVISAVERLS